jgi:folate-binding Fe-S cluster repair protein YgfZ
VYAALLNTKGRLMHDLILHRDESAGRHHTALFVDCPSSTLEQLKANLVRFKLRSHIIVEDASTDLTIVARWSRGLPSISDCNLPAPPGGACFRARAHMHASLSTSAACVPGLLALMSAIQLEP